MHRDIAVHAPSRILGQDGDHEGLRARRGVRRDDEVFGERPGGTLRAGKNATKGRLDGDRAARSTGDMNGEFHRATLTGHRCRGRGDRRNHGRLWLRGSGSVVGRSMTLIRTRGWGERGSDAEETHEREQRKQITRALAHRHSLGGKDYVNKAGLRISAWCDRRE